MLCFFFFNDTATTEIYTLSLTRRSSDLDGAHMWEHPLQQTRIARNHTTMRSPRVSALLAAALLLIPLRSEEHTSELQSQSNLVCRLLLEKKKNKPAATQYSYPATKDTCP